MSTWDWNTGGDNNAATTSFDRGNTGDNGFSFGGGDNNGGGFGGDEAAGDGGDHACYNCGESGCDFLPFLLQQAKQNVEFLLTYSVAATTKMIAPTPKSSRASAGSARRRAT